MGSLAQYIQEMRKQGYSEQQIRAQLKKSNYPKSAIDIAFNASAGDTPLPKSTRQSTSLDSYIKTLLDQGYQVEQLKPYLLDQGYSESQIDFALEKNTGVQPHAKLPLFISALFLIIAIAVGFTLFSIVQNADPKPDIPNAPPASTLQLQLQTETTTVLPGEQLRAELTIQNPATPRQADILFTLEDAAGMLLYENKKTRPLGSELSTAELISIPDNAKPGTYLLTVSLPLEQVEVTRQITIQGIDAPLQEAVALEEPKPVVATSNTKNQIDKAALAAQDGNIRQAQNTCDDLTNQAQRDECYEKLVLGSKNPTYCDKIASTEAKDTCYMPFILEGQYQHCDALQSKDRKELCEQLKLLDSL